MARAKNKTKRRAVSKLPRTPLATVAVALVAAACTAHHEYPELLRWLDVAVRELERAFRSRSDDPNADCAPQARQGVAPKFDASKPIDNRK
jgi:hypothetical protein